MYEICSCIDTIELSLARKKKGKMKEKDLFGNLSTDTRSSSVLAPLRNQLLFFDTLTNLYEEVL